MTPGSKWKHYRGHDFKLIGCCQLKDSLEPHVVYKLWEDGSDYGPWLCRPLSEWDQEVAPGVKRFTEIKS